MGSAGWKPRRQLMLLAGCAAIAAIAWWATRGRGGPLVVEIEPLGVMGTSCSIVAVLPPDLGHLGPAVLRTAEAELRRLEGLFSTWIEASEISGFNRALAGEEVPLSSDSRELLGRARQLYLETAGAFDITSGPLIDTWRSAAEGGRLPGLEELSTQRGASGWEDLRLTETGAVKTRDTVRVDIDGIAKGYAIDRALAALRRAGALGGLVDVGGDLRVSGQAPSDDGWPVGIYDPAAGRAAARIRVDEQAVCTSGGYERHVEIGGRNYSHILDPRSGRPTETVVSATVVAADAATGDAWATALAVLGPEGLELLPAGVEALLLLAGGERPQGLATAGFPEFVGRPGITVERR